MLFFWQLFYCEKTCDRPMTETSNGVESLKATMAPFLGFTVFNSKFEPNWLCVYFLDTLAFLWKIIKVCSNLVFSGFWSCTWNLTYLFCLFNYCLSSSVNIKDLDMWWKLSLTSPISIPITVVPWLIFFIYPYRNHKDKATVVIIYQCWDVVRKQENGILLKICIYYTLVQLMFLILLLSKRLN